MSRFLKAFSLIAIIIVAASCKKDDGANIPPPRDYAVQYKTDEALIEEFLDTHYLVVDPVTLDATFPKIANGETSIRQQTEYELKHIMVTRNKVTYKVYYLSFREGAGDRPTLGDNINFTFRGTLLDGKVFDYREFVSTELPLFSLVKGWWDIIPLFKTGIYQSTNPQDPATFTDYGAGAMFLPSGLAFYNTPTSNLIPRYACTVFTFQLMDLTYTDYDSDGILNKNEVKSGIAPNGYPYTAENTDTDGDGTPDYADIDDDGDGRSTKDELRDSANPTQFFKYEDLFDESGNVKDQHRCNGGTLPKYLDPGCKGGLQ